MRKQRIHRNLNNTPFLGIPLTGPDAITTKYPIAGSFMLPDGRRVLVAEGETCLRKAGTGLRLNQSNILDATKDGSE